MRWLGLGLALLIGCTSEGTPPSGPGSQASTAGPGGTGAGGDGGSGGTPSTGGSAGSPCDVGEPVMAPEDTWTYVPVDGAVCATAGTTAGFFINPTSASKRLVIFFQGGGACFNQADCQASSLGGFDEMQQLNGLGQNPFFNRNLASNPFAQYSFVFFPYCTGDFHSGSTVASYGMQHQGHANVQLYMNRVLPTFCDAEYVLVTGTSAGGFGSTFNYDYIHGLFGSIPVDLVDDSGPYLNPPHMPTDMQTAIDGNWGFRANMPADCAACSTNWHELYVHAATKWSGDRQSLISSLRDPSIQGRFAPYTPLDNLDAFEVAIEDFADQVVTPLASMKVFYVATTGHVWINSPLNQTVTNNVTLEQFLRMQVDDDPAWTSVRP
jgi:hypothetical protein